MPLALPNWTRTEICAQLKEANPQTEEEAKIKMVIPILVLAGIDPFSPATARWELCGADGAFEGRLLLETKSNMIVDRGGIMCSDEWIGDRPDDHLRVDEVGQLWAYCRNWSRQPRRPFPLPPVAAVTNGFRWHLFDAPKMEQLAQGEGNLTADHRFYTDCRSARIGEFDAINDLDALVARLGGPMKP